uniref:Integrase catalytic domain-containing protein n=1 Tax=Nicotiana tabacum TaxID=4097 RepID=A0A1S4BJ22_TOBAC|nr:uncharacterized protein LOC104115637 [Nicotiana tomentosiformis]XP_016488834.1 PREDICTED: uncharacterized protein LOC107808782 [Nicotiana tabacum]
MASILSHCHDGAVGGHYGRNRTAAKVMEAGFFWPTLYKYGRVYVASCDKCQRAGNISKRDEIALNSILVCKMFDVWGIDFMGPFPSSHSYEYILVAADYVSKWVEAIPTRTNDARVVCEFLRKNIFTLFVTPRVIIRDNRSHFVDKQFATLLSKYGVTHKMGTLYHAQTSGQAKVANHELKRILEKVVSASREHRLAQMNALEEFRLDAYENARSFKEKTKRWNNHLIKPKEFHEGDRVLLYNSRLRLFSKKFKSRWTGPYVVKHESPYGAIEIQNKDGTEGFKVLWRQPRNEKPQLHPQVVTREHPGPELRLLLACIIRINLSLGKPKNDSNKRRDLSIFFEETDEANLMVVQEFYANCPEHDAHVCTVMKKRVDFSKEAI